MLRSRLFGSQPLVARFLINLLPLVHAALFFFFFFFFFIFWWVGGWCLIAYVVQLHPKLHALPLPLQRSPMMTRKSKTTKK
jgi:hypothetical protein